MPQGRIGTILGGGQRQQDPLEGMLERILSGRRQKRDPFGRAALPLGASGPFGGRMMPSPVATSPAAPPGPVASPVASPGAIAPSPIASPSVASPSVSAPQAQPMARVPQLGVPASSAGGSQWQNILGLALATVADAMSARAGQRGQAVAGLRGQIAGRETRETERAQREVLRKYRNETQQFEFKQEGVRRRLAKESKKEEREEREAYEIRKEGRLAELLKGASGDFAPEQTVQNRLKFRQELEDAPLEGLTTSGSQALVDAFNNAKAYGISRDTALGELKEAIAKKMAELQRRGPSWKLRDLRYLGGQ